MLQGNYKVVLNDLAYTQNNRLIMMRSSPLNLGYTKEKSETKIEANSSIHLKKGD